MQHSILGYRTLIKLPACLHWPAPNLGTRPVLPPTSPASSIEAWVAAAFLSWRISQQHILQEFPPLFNMNLFNFVLKICSAVNCCSNMSLMIYPSNCLLLAYLLSAWIHSEILIYSLHNQWFLFSQAQCSTFNIKTWVCFAELLSDSLLATFIWKLYFIRGQIVAWLRI